MNTLATSGICSASQMGTSEVESSFGKWKSIMHQNSTAIVNDTPGASSLPDLLKEADKRVGTLGAEFEADRARLDQLLQRLREQRCYLAVLGQFKRGKSTLVNALLGKAVLPTSVVPLTSIPTFLHGGEQLAARVLFDNGKPEEQFSGPDAGALAEFLARFVTESANPHNRLGVRQVEATYPAPVLAKGLALIDTPGIGSTFRHNTEATINFLPQCDAALFVVSADPPITEVEVEFLKLAHRKLARLFFILNKVDYLDADERQVAVAFLQQVLCEQVGFASPPPVLCVSARRAWPLAGTQIPPPGNTAAWRGSNTRSLTSCSQRKQRCLIERCPDKRTTCLPMCSAASNSPCIPCKCRWPTSTIASGCSRRA